MSLPEHDRDEDPHSPLIRILAEASDDELRAAIGRPVPAGATRSDLEVFVLEDHDAADRLVVIVERRRAREASRSVGVLDEPLNVLEDQREPPRERHPWQWGPNVHVERAFLKTADYVLRDHPRLIGLERKTLSDWLGVITGSRTRFVRELERLLDFQHRFVIVEDAGWFSLVSGRYRSRASASSVLGSACAWMLRYRTHVIPAGDPPTAVAIAERLLRRALADHIGREAARGAEADYGTRLLARKNEIIREVVEHARPRLGGVS